MQCQPCGEGLIQCRWCLEMGFCAEYQRPMPLKKIHRKIVEQVAPMRNSADLDDQGKGTLTKSVGCDTPLRAGQPAPPRGNWGTASRVTNPEPMKQTTREMQREKPVPVQEPDARK